ncbi:MAG: type II toxin-antitoxin system RelE/ParE family toxin [Bacteroidota bacterium]
MNFKIFLDPEAHDDIQEGIDWYNQQQSGLGKRFHSVIKKHFNTLKENPHFQVRYNNVHCIPIKKFPFMIHYTIEEGKKRVVIHGIINTHRDPKKWKRKH